MQNTEHTENSNSEESPEKENATVPSLFSSSVIKAPRKKRIITAPLRHYFSDDNTIEVGIDEAGRGPMFGRVYAAAVILPKDNSFNHSLMKDSKRFHSEKKIMEAYE